MSSIVLTAVAQGIRSASSRLAVFTCSLTHGARRALSGQWMAETCWSPCRAQCLFLYLFSCSCHRNRCPDNSDNFARVFVVMDFVNFCCSQNNKAQIAVPWQQLPWKCNNKSNKKRSETERACVVLRVDNASHNKEVNNSDLFEYAVLMKSTHVRIAYFLYEEKKITETCVYSTSS